jgi:hypothetical protein
VFTRRLQVRATSLQATKAQAATDSDSDAALAAFRVMRTESKIQLALALLGVPLLFYVWKADSKWPNPFALDRARPHGAATDPPEAKQ